MVRPRRTIYLQGDLCNGVYRVVTGEVWLCANAPSGKEAHLLTVHQGEFFGECCLDGVERRPFTAKTRILTSFDLFKPQEMWHLLDTNPAFMHSFTITKIRQAQETMAALADWHFLDSESRLIRTLLIMSKPFADGVLHKISQDDLADLTGGSRARVNVSMCRLRDLGHVEYVAGGHIRVLPSLGKMMPDYDDGDLTGPLK